MRVAIVGGGACGTLVAAHLNARNFSGSVTIFDPSETLGQGPAFQRNPPCYRLNVRAGHMSAFPDDPDHFVRWCALRCELPIEQLRQAFRPRAEYGQYLADLARGVDHRRERIESLSALADYDTLVFATGLNAPRVPQTLLPICHAPKFFASPWRAAELRAIAPTDRVLIVGTGLSMMDAVLGLNALGHAGHITAISRHGWLPQVHQTPGKVPGLEPILPPARPVEILRACRAAGDNWRAVIDGIRPRTREIFEVLSTAQQRQFLRHLRARWDVHRHRCPPESWTEIRETKRLNVQRDTPTSAEIDGEVLRVRGNAKVYDVDAVILATGPNPLGAEPSGIWRETLDRGWTRLDPHRLGIVADRVGRLPGANHVFTLGATVLGSRWETTSIPDLRLQARDIAAAIAS